ncbi:hypothetical protein [Clostridium estertheticum]|uniref:hypothetical protein n=1 Tax=Clostridium estertheticum TaxID=238834 RepID=UPI001CF32D31|nr:hypothetical protein [Clostridium estertheticum]MCB2362503.1 hypothetical protein [Clostridium estertheticum]
MVDKLYELLIKEQIINEQLFDQDYDILLDLRDEEMFDDEWIRVYNELEILKKQINEREISKINQIREKSFMLAYNSTKSSDLASCVSDDFELIAIALCVNYNNNWLNALANQYVLKKFPYGQLIEISNQLNEILFKE